MTVPPNATVPKLALSHDQLSSVVRLLSDHYFAIGTHAREALALMRSALDRPSTEDFAIDGAATLYIKGPPGKPSVDTVGAPKPDAAASGVIVPKEPPLILHLDQATRDHIKEHGWPPIIKPPCCPDESGELWELANEICAAGPSPEDEKEWARRLASDLVAAGESEYAPPVADRCCCATCEPVNGYGYTCLKNMAGPTKKEPLFGTPPAPVKNAAEAKKRWETAAMRLVNVQIRLDFILERVAEAADAAMQEAEVNILGLDKEGAELLHNELLSRGFGVRRGKEWGKDERFPMVVHWGM